MSRPVTAICADIGEHETRKEILVEYPLQEYLIRMEEIFPHQSVDRNVDLVADVAESGADNTRRRRCEMLDGAASKHADECQRIIGCIAQEESDGFRGDHHALAG